MKFWYYPLHNGVYLRGEYDGLWLLISAALFMLMLMTLLKYSRR